MEDRNLEQYLFKNFYELKYTFEELMKNHPDYLEKISSDKKILNNYIKYLKTILPGGMCENIPNTDIVTQSRSQITYLLSDISDLERKISLNNRAIQEMNITLQSLNQMVALKDQQLQESSAQTANLTQTVALKDQQLQESASKNILLEQKLSQIKNSIIWQLTTKFHSKIIERFLPQNTRRRKYYDLGLKKGRILVNGEIDNEI